MPIDQEREEVEVFERPRDEDFIDAMRWVALQIASHSGVAPSDLGVVENARYTNVYQFNRQFFHNTIGPRLRRIAATLADALDFDCYFEPRNLDVGDQESAIAAMHYGRAAVEYTKIYDMETVQEWLAGKIEVKDYKDADQERDAITEGETSVGGVPRGFPQR